MRKFGHDAQGAIHSNMSIDFIEPKIGKTADFINAIQYWERKQSMAILGGTLTSQADGKTSTNALGEVHDKVRREIMLHDVRQLAPTINRQLLLPIAFLNGMFPPERMPQFVYETEEPADQQQMINVLAKGAQLGMEIDVDWAHQAMQIPRAGSDAQILGSKQPQPVAELRNRKTAAAAAAKQQEDTGLQADLDAALDALGLQDVADAWLQDMLTEIKDGENDPALLEQLAARWPALDDAALQDRLTSLIFVAEVLGRLEAEQDRAA